MLSNHREIGLPLSGPAHSPVTAALAAGLEAEMEVREMRDPEARQLSRQQR
jgi:hypothetical protein